MKEIYLGGKKRKIALVDDEDFEKLNKYKWFFNPAGNGYAYRLISIHREILDAPKGMEVDHINGNSLDNQRKNLRVCTHAENTKNKSISKNKKSSKYKGVYYYKDTNYKNPWMVATHFNYKRYYLGCFKTEIEAARVYDKFAKKHFGKFAKINFPLN